MPVKGVLRVLEHRNNDELVAEYVHPIGPAPNAMKVARPVKVIPFFDLGIFESSEVGILSELDEEIRIEGEDGKH